MQQKKLLPKKYYYLSRIDERDYSKITYERKEKLELVKELLVDGCTPALAFQAGKMSRATYYRWKRQYLHQGLFGLEPQSTRPKHLRFAEWDNTLVAQVIALRKRYPLFGKAKITVLLKRDYQVTVSESTVGRIIKKLVAMEKIKPVGFYTGKYNPKPRNFDDHAQRLPRGMKSKKPGELVQIDHMTVGTDSSGKWIKHFEAICPTTRYSVGQAFRKASSNNAAQFLDFVQQQLPFPLLSIQVDGGSEFMGDFEAACKAKNIPLYVLPPRSPEMNGRVERINSTVKSEFYKLYEGKGNLEVINTHLSKYKSFYNTFRPHSSLQGLTPMEYWKKL